MFLPRIKLHNRFLLSRGSIFNGHFIKLFLMRYYLNIFITCIFKLSIIAHSFEDVDFFGEAWLDVEGKYLPIIPMHLLISKQIILSLRSYFRRCWTMLRSYSAKVSSDSICFGFWESRYTSWYVVMAGVIQIALHSWLRIKIRLYIHFTIRGQSVYPHNSIDRRSLIINPLQSWRIIV